MNRLLFLLILFALLLRANCAAVDPGSSCSFVLYHSNGTLEVPLTCPGLTTLTASPHFDLTLPSMIYAHGFGTNRLSDTVVQVLAAYLRNGGFNVILIDWSKLAAEPNDLAAVQNVELLGPIIADILLCAVRKKVLCISTLQCVGHSLGAQLWGWIGKCYIQQSGDGSKLPFICGLDPAGPLYCETNTLCSDDAEEVQIIHTDGGGLGTLLCKGTTDFLINGGHSVQPCCTPFPTPGSGDCSHSRAVYLWAECINNNSSFFAVPINNSGLSRPKDWQNSIILMGMCCPKTARGIYCLRTSGEKPYAEGINGVN